MMRVLEGFHHKVARRIAHMMPHQVNGEWIYPPLAEALEESGLYPIREYIRRRQVTITEYIANRPIHHLCRGAPRSTGPLARVLRWWEQDHTAPEAPANGAPALPNDDGAIAVDDDEDNPDDADEMIVD